MEPSFNKNTPAETSAWGATIGILIIVGLLVVGAIYFFVSGGATPAPAPAVGGAQV